MADRPNILCIVSEDFPPLLQAYGDRLARTPHLDRLAGEGVVYENAFSTSPVCGPSRFAILTGRHAESCGPAHHMRSRGPLPSGVVTAPEMLRQAGYWCSNNEKTDYNCDVDPARIWNQCSGSAHWRDRNPEQPFYAVFNSMLTHESCVFDPQPGPIAPSDVTLPPHLPDTEGMRETLARYYNAATRMDAALGQRLRELDEDGLGENTFVLYYSDHASPLPRSKRFCYDDGLRVPMIVRVPERWRHLLPLAPGSRVSAPVSLVDLLPSLAGVAGCPVPDGAQGIAFLGPRRTERRFAFSGRDRMDERYDLTRTVRSERFRYIRNYAPHRPWGQHYAFAWLGRAYQDYEQLWIEGRLTETQARFWQSKPAEELFDCQADPYALDNLAGREELAATLAEMRAGLDNHMCKINDMGFIPEFSDVELFEAASDPARYPFAEVLNLATLTIRREPEATARLVTGLSAPEMVKRYWAAQGLLMLAVQGHGSPDCIGRSSRKRNRPACPRRARRGTGALGSD